MGKLYRDCTPEQKAAWLKRNRKAAARRKADPVRHAAYREKCRVNDATFYARHGRDPDYRRRFVKANKKYRKRHTKKFNAARRERYHQDEAFRLATLAARRQHWADNKDAINAKRRQDWADQKAVEALAHAARIENARRLVEKAARLAEEAKTYGIHRKTAA